MSQYDTESLYEFLSSTPEKGLRSMLIDQQFSEVHFNLLMKVLRAGDKDQFCSLFEAKQFPRVRMNDKEGKLKEKFWQDCEACLLSRGVLFPAVSKPNREAA